jgi:hypothetical protein
MTKKLDHVLLEHVKELLEPLLGLSDDEALPDLLDAVNWDSTALNISDPTTFTAVSEKLSDAIDALDELSENDSVGIVDVAESLATLAETVVAVKNLLTSLPLPPGSPAHTIESLSTDILDFLVDYYLASRHPKLSIILQFLGIFSVEDLPEIKNSNGTVLRAAGQRRHLNFDTLSEALQDPLRYIRQTYLIDADGKRRLADPIADLFGPELAFRLREAGLSSAYGYLIPQLTPEETDSAKRMLIVDAPVLIGADSATTLLRLILALSDETTGLGVMAALDSDISVNINTPAGQLTGELSVGTEPVLITKDSVTFASPGIGGAVPFKATVGFQTDPADVPYLRFGSPDGSRFEIGQLKASVDLHADANGVDIKGTVDLNGLVLAIQGGDGDGFISSVLPENPIELKADVGIDGSLREGIHFRGGGLGIMLPTNIGIGPLEIQSLIVSVSPESGKTRLSIGATVKGSVGPLTVVIEDMGLEVEVSVLPSGGNLGSLQLAVGFKSPDGVGLAVDAAGISGGGFLEHDESKHEYSGVLQLEFNELALQAFGLIATQAAGQATYSLLALIDAEFPPIQLGWGFTLNGVGGLLAVNRTASTDALHAALKANTLSSILFPTNAITNAPLILATLSAIFPPAQGRFVFGPMALIGWGSPPLLKAAIAVIVELPEPVRIILISRVLVHLPSEDHALVRINMDALGILDLSQDSLSLDATLFDSKLIDFTLSGDMALRANWASSQRTFLLSVGGCHPQFTPPAGFPALQRITIDMPSGPVSKLRLAAYLALSSNTIQFGATLDVFIGVSGFGLSGHLGFDALLQRDPLHFDADISGRVALTAGGDDLMSIGLDATLSGPAPWHIAGDFKIHIVFFDVHKSFSHSWGDDAPALSIAPVNVLSLLTADLADARNWGAPLPPATSALVSLTGSDKSVVHPLARLEVHESTVPLNLAITRYGSAAVSGATSFSITDYQVNGKSVDRQPVEDDFAPAQFFDLSDDEKLARPSFETHDAGVRLTGTGLVGCGAPVTKTISYETFYIDQANGILRTDPVPTPKPFGLGDLTFVLAIGASGRATIRAAGNRRYNAPGNPMKIVAQKFIVTDKNSLLPAGVGPAQGTTYSDAAALLHAATVQIPAQISNLQIVAKHELAAT